ncbi:MAG: hypothetical protein WDZ41_04930 [Candidatus Babeliales bacterium]
MMKNKKLLLAGLFGLSSLLCYKQADAALRVEKSLSSITNNTGEGVIVMIEYKVPGEADRPTVKSEATTLKDEKSFETDLTPKYGRGGAIYEKKIIAKTIETGKTAEVIGKAGQNYLISKLGRGDDARILIVNTRFRLPQIKLPPRVPRVRIPTQ